MARKAGQTPKSFSIKQKDGTGMVEQITYFVQNDNRAFLTMT